MKERTASKKWVVHTEFPSLYNLAPTLCLDSAAKAWWSKLEGMGGEWCWCGIVAGNGGGQDEKSVLKFR